MKGIKIPQIKKWPGYTFTFHCWIRLRTDYKYIEKKRRQLYSFYTTSGQGLEAFLTADLTTLVVCICTKKEYLTVQITDLEFENSEHLQHKYTDVTQNTETVSLASFSTSSCIINEFTDWHSIAIMHVPAKNAFSSSRLCVYIDGKLKRDCDFKQPNLFEAFTNVTLFGACSQAQSSPQHGTSSTVSKASAQASTMAAVAASAMSKTLIKPFKNIFSITQSLSTQTQASDSKTIPVASSLSTSITSIPTGTQDIVWEMSTCIQGQLSSCFILYELLTEAQIKLIYSLGPNQYNLNWLELNDLSDLKQKFMFYYDAKCCKVNICYDLAMHSFNAEFVGKRYALKNFKVIIIEYRNKSNSIN